MVTEKARLKEWLSRVALGVVELKSSTISDSNKLKLIQENYGILSVLIRVANGNAYMVGVPPISNTVHK
jgi:hypothetical protein